MFLYNYQLLFCGYRNVSIEKILQICRIFSIQKNYNLITSG